MKKLSEKNFMCLQKLTAVREILTPALNYSLR